MQVAGDGAAVEPRNHHGQIGQREITPAGFRVKSTFAMKCWVDHHGNASVRRGHDAPLLTNDDDTTDDHRKHHC